MTIHRFKADKAGQDAAFALPDPKNIAFENAGFTVRTGADYEAPPAASKDDTDIAAAKEYGKLKALAGMSPAEVQAWVAGSVKDLAAAQDAIATLAIAVSVLVRKL